MWMRKKMTESDAAAFLSMWAPLSQISFAHLERHCHNAMFIYIRNAKTDVYLMFSVCCRLAILAQGAERSTCGLPYDNYVTQNPFEWRQQQLHAKYCCTHIYTAKCMAQTRRKCEFYGQMLARRPERFHVIIMPFFYDFFFLLLFSASLFVCYCGVQVNAGGMVVYACRGSFI